MPFLNVGTENSSNIDLYYEDHGSGNPVVLIHGWPLSGRSWEKQVSVLLKAGYRIITYDRRGFGESDKPTSGYDYDTLANDLHQLVTSLDLHNITLIGFSMGGGEVARYLGKFGSARVSKAVFLASILPYLLKTADNSYGLNQAIFDDIKTSINFDRLAFLTTFFNNFYNSEILAGKLISKEAIQFSWNIGAQASPAGSIDCVSAWLTDFRSDLAHITIPTLIIHGDADRILPIDATGKRAHELVKGSQLHVVKGAPHGLTWTHADQVNKLLLDFLGKR